VENRKKFSEWAELFDHADLGDNTVFRYWIVQMMLQIHGDLDSISYCLREAVRLQGGDRPRESAARPAARSASSSRPQTRPARQGGSRSR
jgi:hypothetical protein